MKVVIIGSGFAGLSAASFMAKEGWEVTVIEKHATPGGRARQLEHQGFRFDMGPSWYWMPDVFERYFRQFGKNVSDYYTLQRLDPSYRVYWEDNFTDVPANYEELRRLFNSIQPGAGKQLDRFLKEAAYKYSVGINKLVYKPGLSISEFMDWEVISGIFRLDIFSSIKKTHSSLFHASKAAAAHGIPSAVPGRIAGEHACFVQLNELRGYCRRHLVSSRRHVQRGARNVQTGHGTRSSFSFQ